MLAHHIKIIWGKDIKKYILSKIRSTWLHKRIVSINLKYTFLINTLYYYRPKILVIRIFIFLVSLYIQTLKLKKNMAIFLTELHTTKINKHFKKKKLTLYYKYIYNGVSFRHLKLSVGKWGVLFLRPAAISIPLRMAGIILNAGLVTIPLRFCLTFPGFLLLL